MAEMSIENVEIVERWIRAYCDRDLERLKGVADPNIELRMAGGNVFGGHEGLARWTKNGWEADAPHFPRIERCMPKGDTVFALLRAELRSPETGEIIRTLPVGAEWRIRDGLVIEWAARPDRDGLLEDAGLRE